jgi:hypothetical protein
MAHLLGFSLAPASAVSSSFAVREDRAVFIAAPGFDREF